MKTKIASIALAAAALTVLLSSCSSQPDSPQPKPSASKSASASAPKPTLPETPGAAYELDNKVVAPCTDGTARIDTPNAETTVEGDCDNVIVAEDAAWGLVYLKGAVKTLTVEANLTGVYGAAMNDVVIKGDGNDITHTGSEPNVKDEGDNNRVSLSEQG